MYNQPEAVQLRPVYQMQPSVAQTLHSTKEQVRGLCRQYLHHPVRVQTVHGHTYDGVITHIDAYHVYLQMMPGNVRVVQADARGFLNPFFGAGAYNNFILPLVLYELLVISLL
ncbi:hypothetical protein SK3146_02307 [Paenibacillus konkukensis]|uniref:Acetyl-CoA acetyltransferase n=2 Tax=Paenibacillus TaxID=44249 RepID=A0ABY4RKW2_9BACL|nr:hypothetical protein SK3146_02307 [Paenibacillus konkukensis]